MTPLLLLCAFAGMEFNGQDMPGLSAGARSFLTGLAPVNTSPADFDGDGKTDLLLADAVWLRRGEGYPDAGRLPLADVEDASHYITDGRSVFAYDERRLTRYDLRNGRWLRRWSADIPSETRLVEFPAPFFHDVDGDGDKELLVAAENELHVFRTQYGLEAAGKLAIYPPLRPALEPSVDLWSQNGAAGAASVLGRRFRLDLDGQQVTTLERLPVGHERVEFRRLRFTLEASAEDTIRAVQDTTLRSPPLWEGMLPCNLNSDNRPDLAGLRKAETSGFSIAVPYTEVLLSTDNGGTVQPIRTKAALSQIALADFDGDGDHDLISERSDLFEGPPKEVLTKLSSKTRVKQSFWVHVQQAGGTFDRIPRRFHAVRIDLGTTPLSGGPRWDAYRAAALLSGTADFNGDRRADVAVWETPGRVAVYLNQEGLFRNDPDAVLTVPRGSRMRVADVDWDGLADIIILEHAFQSGGGTPHVFLARWKP